MSGFLTDHHKYLLKALALLPLDDQRINYLLHLKDSPCRYALMRKCITAVEVSMVLGCSPIGDGAHVVASRFSPDDIIEEYNYGKDHEHDALQLYVSAVKVIVALAAAGHSLQQFKDTIPRAFVTFCSSEGSIIVHEVVLNTKAERAWGKALLQVSAFYTEKLLNKLAAELDIAAVPTASLISSPISSRAAASTDMAAAAPSFAVDQSPGLRVGKTVEDPKRRRRGEVEKLLPDGKVIIKWEGTERKRQKPCKIESLIVPPILRDVPAPDCEGQVVYIVGGARQDLIGQHGHVVRFAGEYSYVSLATSGSSDVPLKIKNEFLAADAPRKATVPASTDSFKMSMSEFRTAMPALLRAKSVKLIGCTVDNFVEGWERAREQLAFKKSSPRRNRKINK